MWASMYLIFLYFGLYNWNLCFSVHKFPVNKTTGDWHEGRSSLGPAHMLTDPTYHPMVSEWHKVEIKVDWLRLWSCSWPSIPNPESGCSSQHSCWIFHLGISITIGILCDVERSVSGPGHVTAIVATPSAIAVLPHCFWVCFRDQRCQDNDQVGHISKDLIHIWEKKAI